ncbi:MAG: hypothetical protein WBP85_11265 [Terracidiphilus sp.]
MKRRFQPIGSTATPVTAGQVIARRLAIPRLFPFLLAASALAFLFAAPNSAQVITVDTSGKGPVAPSGPVDRRYAQIQPTHIQLSKTPLDVKTRLELERALQAEQGFANRPFPRGHKGLTLQANGKLEPVGTAYLNMVISEGISAKPGSRVVVTDIRFDHSKIIFDLDGGPDAKHRFLSHLQVNLGDPGMEDTGLDPSLANPNGEPAGARITLNFPGGIPELTPAQLKALIAPLVSFDVKSPVQAFTDTLPADLKNSILGHQVLVGMTTDMVIFAKGLPTRKTREMDGQMPFEEWIYGTPPEEVDFVRINGNRVIRLEIARDGEPLQVFTKDVVSAMMVTDENRAVLAQATTRTVREGDVEADPSSEAPQTPSLRNPGEKLPNDQNTDGVMRPVQFPKPHPDDEPGANPDEQPATSAPAGQTTQASYPQGQGSAGSAPANGSQPPAANNTQPPANGSQPQSAPAKASPAPSGTQQPSSSTSQLVTRGSSPQPN